jgi:hypothetical protein
LLQEIRSTILAEQLDAQEQAVNFVNFRGTPRTSLEAVSVNLANDAMTDTVRDDLLAVSMDTLLYVDNIPVGLIPAGFFEGFVRAGLGHLVDETLNLLCLYLTQFTQHLMYNGKITTH